MLLVSLPVLRNDCRLFFLLPFPDSEKVESVPLLLLVLRDRPVRDSFGDEDEDARDLLRPSRSTIRSLFT